MAHSRGNLVAPATEALTISECAASLGLTERQVSNAVARGAPTLRRGTKGRGHATLVDAEQVSQWMALNGSYSRPYVQQLADRLTRASAAATVSLIRAAAGPHKLAVAAAQVRQFMETDCAQREQLGLPPLRADELPADIKQITTMLSIFD